MPTVFPQTLGQQQPAAPAFVDPYAAQIEAARARLNAAPPPMYTPEQVQQRRADNDRQYSLGLLGQLSGDAGLSDVGGQVFKQALAARQPKISERGVADPITGQFTYDPDYLRKQQEAVVQGLEAKSAAARASYDAARMAAQERAERQREHDETVRAMRGAAGGAAADARAARQDNQRFKLEDSMADDFRKEISKPQLVVQAHNGLKATAQRTDAASDIAFVYQYMKILDPTSVVREGEFATAQNAAGIPDRMRNAYNQALSGTRLNPKQRADMLGAAQRLAAEAEADIKTAAKRYQETARQRGLDLNSVTPGYYTPEPEAPVIDVGAALGRPPAPPRALPKSAPKPSGANRVVDAGW